jgi:membrane-associated protease RseP (regulator of RpoE activity)
MSRNRTIIVSVIVAVLFVACNLVVCIGGLVAGGAMATMRSHVRTRHDQPFDRDRWDPEPLPRPRQERVAALVVEVHENSPAEDAGIEAGDLILAVDSEEIGPDSDLRDVISAYEPGDRIELVVWRGARQREIQVRLGRQSEERGVPYLGITYRMMPIPLDTE